MKEQTKKMIEERAIEASNIYWQNEEIETGWHWDNSGKEYKDDFRRLAKHVLASELRAFRDGIIRGYELGKGSTKAGKDNLIASITEQLNEIEAL